MAIQQWERSLTPQGGVEAPRGTSLGAVIGAGVQDLGQAATQVAGQVVRAEDYEKERDWQAEQPKIAQAIAETDAGSAQAIADIKAKAPVDLAGYSDAVSKYWDDQKATLAQKFTGERAQQYIDLQLTGRKGDALSRASVDTTAAKVGARADSIQKTLDLGVNTVMSNTGQYAATLANINATLDAQVGAIPAATIDDWRTKAGQALAAANLGGQINADPYAAKKMLESGKWDAAITPQQKAALQNNADAGIRDREIQAAKAQAAAEKAQREQADVQLSDLSIKLGRGQAGYQDIEKAFNGGNGWLDPNDRSRLTLALDAQNAKDAEQQQKAQAGFNFVAGAKLGAYQVDPKNTDQMKAVNADYLNQAKLWTEPSYDPVSGATSQRTPEQVADLTLDYVTNLGVVPEALQGQLRGQIRSGSDTDMAAAANTLEQFRQVNPALLDDFSPTDIDRANLINTQVRNGVPPAQAVVNTLAMQKVDKTTADFRSQSYDEMTKPPTGRTRLQTTQGEIQAASNNWTQRYVPGVSNPAIPPEMAGAYETLKKDAYLRTGNLDVAKKTASDALSRTWGQTGINGSTSWMKTPPENFYSAPPEYSLTPDQNTDWMKDQLVTEFTGGGTAMIDEKAGPVKDRLSLVPSTQVGPDGKPLYSVMFRASTGDIGPAVDAKGQAMLWAPDWQSSAKKKELDAAAATRLQGARDKRELGGGPSQYGISPEMAKKMRGAADLSPATLAHMSESQVQSYLQHQESPFVVSDYRAQGAPHPEYQGGTGRPDDIAPELQSAMPEPAKTAPKAELQTAMPEPRSAADLPSAAPIKALNLTKQEQFLYQHHVDNVTKDKIVWNKDGSGSTIRSVTIQADVDGKKRYFEIPTVWDGKILPKADAEERAKQVGIFKFPSYATEAEADARYQKMHDSMALDIPDDTEREIAKAKTPLDRALAPVPADLKKLPGYFKKASDADLATIAGSGKDVPAQIRNAASEEMAKRKVEPDQIQGDELSAEPAPGPQSNAAPKSSYLQVSLKGASDKELSTLKKQAQSKTIRDAVEAEITRRGRA